MIQLRDLAVGYDKHNPVLTDLNYKFDKKIYGIVGQSGVGKTTTLKTIAKLIPPLHGYIIVPEHEHVYMMHQHYTCFDWLDCLDNILIAKKIISRKILILLLKRLMKSWKFFREWAFRLCITKIRPKLKRNTLTLIC